MCRQQRPVLAVQETLSQDPEAREGDRPVSVGNLGKMGQPGRVDDEVVHPICEEEDSCHKGDRKCLKGVFQSHDDRDQVGVTRGQCSAISAISILVMPEHQTVLYQRTRRRTGHICLPARLRITKQAPVQPHMSAALRRHPNLQPSQERKGGSAHASSQKLNSRLKDPMPPLMLTTTTTTATLTANVNKRSGGV